MLTAIIDGNGVARNLITPGQETVVDKSGHIAVTNTSQVAIAANSNRSGWFIQNLSAVPGQGMWINDLGVDASETPADGNTSIYLDAGDYYPRAGQPVTTKAISIIGTAGDAYAAREW